MLPLPPWLRRLFGKAQGERDGRVFSLNDRAALTLMEIAETQNRPEEDVFKEVIEAGLSQVMGAQDNGLSETFTALSLIEQRITCLLCSEYSSSEIARILSVSYDTVRHYSKQIYRKFGMQRRDLRKALGHWDFAEWWEHNQP